MSDLEDALIGQIKLAGLTEPEREIRFHPTRKWRFDFFWSTAKVACEVEGGIWISGGGRHNRASSFVKDAEKYNEAALLGIMVLRVCDKQIKDGSALAWIERALHG